METKKILVAEDEEILRKLLHDVLCDEGYEVTSASSGREALEKVKQDRFDLLLTDIKMPDVDGFQLIRSLRAINAETIPIVMTGYASLESARAAIKEGAYDYVLKPFEVSEIKTVVANSLERKRLAGENARLKNLVGLFKVSEIITTGTDPDKLLQVILESALAQTGATRGSLMLLNEKNQELTIRTSVGLDEELARNTRVKLGEGIAGLVAKEGEPLLVTDVENHPLFRKLCRHYKDRSFISVPLSPDEESLSIPLQTKKRVIGVLNISRKKDGGTFTESDLELLCILGTQSAISVENAQLYQQLQKRAELLNKELAEANDSLKRTNHKLRELDEAKSHFLSIVSHELKTPLTSIKSFSEILLKYKGQEPETQQEFLTIINQESMRLSRLINNLLDLSRIESGKMEWERKPLNISEIVDASVKAMRPLASEKAVGIVLDIRSDLPAVQGDKDRLVEVLTNLLTNALDFTETGGTVTIAAKAEGNNVEMSVTDTGIGIPADKLDKVFEKFYQVDSSFTRPREGTGLGLTICKEIVESHGGRIWAASQGGKGSTFTFTLPVN